MLNSIKEIVDDIIQNLSPEHTKEIKSFSKDQLRRMHFTLGMSIRNHYGLWLKDNPITKEWHDLRESDSTLGIVNHTDTHEKHPDQVSDQIISLLWDKLNGSLHT